MTGPKESSHQLSLVRDIEASRERVFDAWLQPEALARFMKPAEGVVAASVEVDPREGGSFLINMRVGDQDLPHHGQYRVIDRPHRLVFTWLSENAAEGSVVTLVLEELGAGRTRLTLHHDGLQTERAQRQHRMGWTRILESLGTELFPVTL